MPSADIFTNPFKDPEQVPEQYRKHPSLENLFKCRQWLWLVVPGLRDDVPTELI